jgi:penicillin-binding protein 2
LKQAIEMSCDTVFYKVAYDMWLKDGGLKGVPHPAEPIATMAHAFGLGSRTGIDLPGEAKGDIEDRAEKQRTWNQMKDIWCKRGKDGYPELLASDPSRAAYLKAIASENCIDGYLYRGGDAVISAIGQGGDLLSPLQLARVYAAVANGGTLFQPQIGRALLTPDGKLVKELPPIASRKVPVSDSTLAFLQDALHGTALEGTAAPAFAAWPQALIPAFAKTGTAEVYGKQTTSCFVAFAGTSTGPRYVVAMMVSQGGTGVGTSGPSVEKILEAIYGVDMGKPDPNGTLPTTLPAIKPDGLLPALPAADSLPTPPPPTVPGSGPTTGPGNGSH